MTAVLVRARTEVRPAPLRSDPALRFAGATVGVILSLFGCAAVGASSPVATVVVLVIAVGCSRGLPAPAAGAVGLTAWAFLTGFAVHSFGQLTFGHADLARLALLLACGVLASLTHRSHVDTPAET